MDKQRTEQIVFGVLLVFAGFFVYRQIAPWVFPKTAKPVPVTRTATQLGASASASASAVDVIAPTAPRSGTFQAGRDPFWPAEDVAILLGLIEPPMTDSALLGLLKPPELVVQGLVWKTARPQAIVNDQVVTIGDEIAGAFVRHINRRGITVEYRGQEFVISPLPPAAARGGGSP